MSSSSERRLRILAQLNNGAAGDLEVKRLCQICAEVTGMSGAGIMLMSNDVPRGAVCSTDEVSAVIEDLQFALVEGPCVDAFHLETPVLEPDLAEPVTPRWLGFTGPAVEAGARAVFGFPLQLGAVRLGALNLYRTEPGPLTDDQHADALVMADVAAQALLVMQADAPPGQLAASIEDGSDFQHVVHQASGMVSAQLEVTVGQALIRLRAHAFGNDRPLVVVAQDVVARRLRFDAQSGEKDPRP
ncbi:MAG TPA: GAF and ANTAR domain-containing protein [Acidimicrobiales bacterium]|nr:GAF and ANTAR domain-containing protein [Acidimicrobiales bacterium]